MTPADIIKLAAEHGLAIDMTTPVFEALDIVFKLGAIVEREECAKVCEALADDFTPDAYRCVAAIRARGTS